MKSQLQLAIIASLTVGLAPFTPHPHIWKQIRNIWFDRPMETIDWLDLLMHGAPWVYLLFVLGAMLYKKKKTSSKLSQ